MDQIAPALPRPPPHDATRPTGTTVAADSGWRSFVLFGGAVLLPALILLAAARTAWDSAWADTERELSVAAEAAAEYALRVIEGHGRLAHGMSATLPTEDGAIRAAAPALAGQLAAMLAELPLAAAAVVRGADGEVMLHAAQPGAPETGVPDLRHAGFMSIGRGLAISAAFLPRPGAPPVVALGPDTGGRAVIILLDANLAAAGMGRLLDQANDSGALVRADGQILMRQPPFRAPPPPLGADKPLRVVLAGGATSGRVDGETPRDGRPVLVRFRRIEGHADLLVAVARPREAVTQRWSRGVAPLLMIGLPAILALGGLAWLVRGKQRALQRALTGLELRVAERTASLRESEERMRLAIGAGRFGTWETDIASGTSTRSARTLEIFGFEPGRAVAPLGDWTARIHAADRARMLEAWDRTALGRTAGYREEYRFLRPDGSWRWLESTAAVVRSDPATGRPTRLAGTVRDITDRREEEERRELLTQEVNHRARNALAIVQAIMRLTRAEDASGYARIVEGRIAALARAQSLLTAERWTGAPLPALLAEELAAFGAIAGQDEEGRGCFVLSGEPLRLRPEAVQPLGIVFHELATNAAKHGALSVPQGRVEVAWEAAEPAGILRIRWTETGGPPPAMPQQRGVGSRVIEATVVGQLGGQTERRWPAEGLVCEISIPLARVRAGPA